jgi:hypothetical protein
MDPDPRFFALVHILAGLAARLELYAPAGQRVDILNAHDLAVLGETGRAYLAARTGHVPVPPPLPYCACATCGGGTQSPFSPVNVTCWWCRQRGCRH